MSFEVDQVSLLTDDLATVRTAALNFVVHVINQSS